MRDPIDNKIVSLANIVKSRTQRKWCEVSYAQVRGLSLFCELFVFAVTFLSIKEVTEVELLGAGKKKKRIKLALNAAFLFKDI